MRPQFAVVVNVLLPISCHIGYDIFAHLFLEEMVALLAMDVKTCLWSELENNIINDQVKFAAKNIKTKFIACELSVQRA